MFPLLSKSSQETVVKDTLAGVKVITDVEEPKRKPKINWKKIFALILFSFFLVVSRAAHTLLAQPFKKHLISGRKLHVPVYHSLLEASSFPISVVFWIVLALYKRGTIAITNWQYRMKMYVAMAAVDAFNSVVGAIGLNVLPPAVYTILKSSSIIFAVLFSRAFTTKRLNRFHYLGAAILCISVTIITCSTNQVTLGSSDRFDFHMFKGICGALLSAISVAFLGVLTYAFFVKEKCKGDIVVVAENNAFQAFFMWIFLLPLLATSEAASWKSTLAAIEDNGTMSTFFVLSILMLLCRPIAEFGGIAVTNFSSNVLTRALGGVRRIFVLIGAVYIFHEAMPLPKILSAVFMNVALVVYVYGGYRLMLDKRTEDIDRKPADSEAKT